MAEGNTSGCDWCGGVVPSASTVILRFDGRKYVICQICTTAVDNTMEVIIRAAKLTKGTHN